MKILVTGGRDYANQSKMFEVLDRLHEEHIITTVVQGGAKGADKLAQAWASSRMITWITYHPDWEKHGLAAGPIRNSEMIKEKPGLVVAFPGGKGTADMVRKSREAGLTVVTIDS